MTGALLLQSTGFKGGIEQHHHQLDVVDVQLRGGDGCQDPDSSGPIIYT
jgi:hypothetical protein